MEDRWVKILVGLAVLGGLIWFYINFLTPNYVILQAERSISLSKDANRDFVISPAKVLITRFGLGSSITIPVKVDNGEGDARYIVEEKEPSIFDAGFENADSYGDYEYSWDKSILDMKGSGSDTVNITVKKRVLSPHSNLEKGIAITQTTDSQGIVILRSYVFEILTK